MTALDNALASAQERIAAYNPGVQNARPQERSQEWFELRGLAIVQAFMQRVQTLEIENDPAACERLYKACLKVFKQAEVPPEPKIVRETLPGGSLPSGHI